MKIPNSKIHQSILLLFLYASCSLGCNDRNEENNYEKGKEIVYKYCTSCHLISKEGISDKDLKTSSVTLLEMYKSKISLDTLNIKLKDTNHFELFKNTLSKEDKNNIHYFINRMFDLKK